MRFFRTYLASSSHSSRRYLSGTKRKESFSSKSNKVEVQRLNIYNSGGKNDGSFCTEQERTQLGFPRANQENEMDNTNSFETFLETFSYIQIYFRIFKYTQMIPLKLLKKQTTAKAKHVH